MGSDMTSDDFDRFMTTVGEHQGVSGAVEEAFVLALNAAGIPFHEDLPSDSPLSANSLQRARVKPALS
jgi:hypothetical protein